MCVLRRNRVLPRHLRGYEWYLREGKTPVQPEKKLGGDEGCTVRAVHPRYVGLDFKVISGFTGARRDTSLSLCASVCLSVGRS